MGVVTLSPVLTFPFFPKFSIGFPFFTFNEINFSLLENIILGSSFFVPSQKTSPRFATDGLNLSDFHKSFPVLPLIAIINPPAIGV